MRKFFRKYYQEITAVALIFGFWGSVWGYQAYTTTQARHAIERASIPSGPGDFEPEPTAVPPAN